MRENIEKRCDVFPLRPKTEEYVKAAYRWAINNRKIVHVMDTEPVYVLAQKDSAGQHIFLVSADSEGSIMVFVSEEAAEAHRDILSDESTEIEVVKILLPSLFHLCSIRLPAKTFRVWFSMMHKMSAERFVSARMKSFSFVAGRLIPHRFQLA